MIYLRYLCVAFAAALAATYSTLWVVSPTPLESLAVTVPPLKVNQQGNDLLLWGAWKTIAGYDHGLANVSVHSKTSCHPADFRPRVTSHSTTRGYFHEKTPHRRTVASPNRSAA